MWDKEKKLSSNEESNLRPSDSALRCSTTEPQRPFGKRSSLRSSYGVHTARIETLRKHQEPVRRETTEGSSIEVIGYRMPQHEQTGCTVSFTRYQSTNACRAFSIFRVVVLISAFKVGVAKNT
ncbi:unnamed protein product [Pocillopora meandrina]|uniref:Uncharacterized protein n=1 Tax=Pocillopora meandrina TaxID=46732 RepID=A0AAU9W8M3_9CNID|nr:unnamed protein product [Pocillopora meandrina]